MATAAPVDETMFHDFIRRIRAGDQQAAADLVRLYEPIIRREVHFRLADPRLGRLFDSTDISQSVLCGFFTRAAAGHFDLDRPDQLIRLLVTMVRNKLANQVRRHRKQRRDYRRLESRRPEELDCVPGVFEEPGQLVSEQELLEAVRHRLSGEEQQLAELRTQGKRWDEITTLLGGTAQARRKQLERAMTRISRQLRLRADA